MVSVDQNPISTGACSQGERVHGTRDDVMGYDLYRTNITKNKLPSDLLIHYHALLHLHVRNNVPVLDRDYFFFKGVTQLR